MSVLGKYSFNKLRMTLLLIFIKQLIYSKRGKSAVIIGKKKQMLFALRIDAIEQQRISNII